MGENSGVGLSVDTLESMSWLVSVYTSQGRWGPAEQLQLQIRDRTIKHHGLGHPDTLKSERELEFIQQQDSY